MLGGGAGVGVSATTTGSGSGVMTLGCSGAVVAGSCDTGGVSVVAGLVSGVGTGLSIVLKCFVIE